MKARRATKLLIEPPALATGDIAFNLIVFFLVCASVQPDSGRKQTLPRSETQTQETTQAEQVQILLTRTAAALNGNVVREPEFVSRLRSLLANKTRPEDKIVIVQSKPEVPYRHWIKYTGMIEEAGGIITVLREEEQEVRMP